MEARSVLDDSQQYRGTDSEEPRMPERNLHLSSKFRTLVELTLTLLKEIEWLKDIQELHARNHRPRLSLKDELCRFEIEMIRKALLQTGGHQSRAARLLGVKVSTLHEKIKRYGIDLHMPVENDDAASSLDVSADDET
jgi:DNA-binding NtrC family response regulator